ncbi:transcription factor bHLH52-like [Coffea arabica]|uniref:Transcription factor bHLH52-like n=1 Tax=Coffea arabica TaxID=13443 RepID=A0A6P6W3Q1_COFAR|nr:transcription factor bHLH52-like [Coffea arabica]
MALSCYSNWGELEQHHDSEMTLQFAQPPAAELSPELLGFNHMNFAFSDPYLDPILESQDLVYSDNYTSLLPHFSSPSDENSNSLYSLVPEVFPELEYQPCHSAKRQKIFEGCYNNSEVLPSSFGSRFIPNPPLLQELSPPEILSPFSGSLASKPPVFCSGSTGEMTVKKASNGGTLSSQSIAARQRRRKITEKTQELGKLIPGGQKMNTAEMFQAASKYIKFLQAQVGILETLASVQENGKSLQNEELNPLLGSSLIQEKLYSMEMCLAPQKFVQSLAEDNGVELNTQALNDCKELIGIGC